MVGYSGSTKDRLHQYWDRRVECAPLTIWEDHVQLENTAIPQGILLSGHGTLPALQVQSALRSLLGLCDKAEGVITAPLLAVRSTVVSAFLAKASLLSVYHLRVSLTAPLGGDSGTATS